MGFAACFGGLLIVYLSIERLRGCSREELCSHQDRIINSVMRFLILIVFVLLSFQVNAQEKIIYCDVWGAKIINTKDEIYKKDKVDDEISEYSKKLKIVFDINEYHQRVRVNITNLKNNHRIAKLLVVPTLDRPIGEFNNGLEKFESWEEKRSSSLLVASNILGATFRIENNKFQFFDPWYWGGTTLLLYGDCL